MGDNPNNVREGNDPNKVVGTPAFAHYRMPGATAESLLFEIFRRFESPGQWPLETGGQVRRFQRVITLPVSEACLPTDHQAVVWWACVEPHPGVQYDPPSVVDGTRPPDFRGGTQHTWLSFAQLDRPFWEYNVHTFPWHRVAVLVLQCAPNAEPAPNPCQHCVNENGPFASCRQVKAVGMGFALRGVCINCLHHGGNRVRETEHNNACSLMEPIRYLDGAD